MTCVIGVESNGRVYLGGDAIATDLTSAWSISDTKVFERGPVVFGFAGSFREGQLIKYGLVIPEHDKTKSDMEWLVIDLIDSIRALYRDKGILKKESEIETVESTFLIGYRGKLYYIDADLHVNRTEEGFLAIGSGADIALGSLETSTSLTNLSTEERMLVALRAAEKWSPNVKSPFTIVSDTTPVKSISKRSKK